MEVWLHELIKFALGALVVLLFLSKLFGGGESNA